MHVERERIENHSWIRQLWRDKYRAPPRVIAHFALMIQGATFDRGFGEGIDTVSGHRSMDKCVLLYRVHT